jgi:beta-lactamase class A
MRALLLTFLLTTAAAVAQQPSALENQLHAIAAAHHGSVSLYATNLSTHQTVAIAPDTPVQTASVIKLLILYEALQQLRTGKVALTDAILLPPAARVPGSGILTLLDAPLTLTFKDILTLMIALSDNTATNLAIDHLGLEAINTALPLPNTHLYKKVFTPVDPGTTLPADFKQFGLGKTTPREITTVLQKLVTCDLPAPARPADAQLCATALHMLQLQFTRTAIPRYLDRLPGYNDTSIANKTGALNAVRNDVAAISTPAGLILISAFTYANADHTWGADHEAELTIAKLARAIVAAWSPQGLAPWPASVDAVKSH